MNYIGRFAPSPSGALHFGSLVTALASYCQAKSKNGVWQVRIEDIDPPREVEGASEDILQTLQTYGLQWDGDVIYQSQQSDYYQHILGQLKTQQISYYCDCTRKQIKAQGGIYLGTCRDKQQSNLKNNTRFSLRINLNRLEQPVRHFNDQLLGEIKLDEQDCNDDFIIQRKDGLYAYNLAVVLDDIKQGITEIVRGADLINTTGKQQALYFLLNKYHLLEEPACIPKYVHIPLVVNALGLKLSKQNHARAIDKENPIPTLLKALDYLGQIAPNNASNRSVKGVVDWAVKNWQLQKVPH
ncbi:MAG TPA: tRNA glutamyl-Q(34) synthetase GluQRS [Psychromonas hadalis]|nr:tRNA glutamyl-Q(34) synthetase GluQRS [Psychromonas hadalis]